MWKAPLGRRGKAGTAASFKTVTLKDAMCTKSERVIYLFIQTCVYIFLYISLRISIYKTALFIVIYSWTYTSPVEEIHSTQAKGGAWHKRQRGRERVGICGGRPGRGVGERGGAGRGRPARLHPRLLALSSAGFRRSLGSVTRQNRLFGPTWRYDSERNTKDKSYMNTSGLCGLGSETVLGKKTQGRGNDEKRARLLVLQTSRYSCTLIY